MCVSAFAYGQNDGLADPEAQIRRLALEKSDFFLPSRIRNPSLRSGGGTVLRGEFDKIEQMSNGQYAA